MALTTERSKWLLDEVKGFAISAGASATGAVAVFPVDVVKTRLQNQKNSAKVYANGWDCFKKIIKTEGPLRLYSGLFPYMLGQVPEKAMRLFVVNQVRGATHTSKWAQSLSKERRALLAEILAGTAAGTCQVAITNPMEVLKVRMQVYNQGTAQSKPSMIALGREIGFRGMYKGASACLWRDVPFSGIYFPVYYASKATFSGGGSPHTLSGWEVLLSATFAGAIAAGVVTPADVVKTRMQAANQKVGMFQTFTGIVKNEGQSALWKGLLPRVFRSAPQYGVMLLAYEVLQRTFLPAPEHLNEPQAEMRVIEDRWQIMRQWEPPNSFVNTNIRKVSVGGMGNIWGIGTNSNVYKWTGFSWSKVEGEVLDYISVGADGAVCGVKDGVGVRLNPWTMKFYPIIDSPRLKSISVGNSAKIWGVGESGYPYKYRVDGRWKQRGTRKIHRISVGADGAVWAIEEGTYDILRWKSDINEWEVINPPSNSKPKSLSTCSRSNVLVIERNSDAWTWVDQINQDGGVWQQVSSESVSDPDFSTLIKLDEHLTKLIYSKYDKILGVGGG